ncbi:histatherin-like [Equus asinus]|uniref:histatherin-like n=1 Tax=Equus asinus TaxID=9793 RepID=UPI0038F6D07D
MMGGIMLMFWCPKLKSGTQPNMKILAFAFILALLVAMIGADSSSEERRHYRRRGGDHRRDDRSLPNQGNPAYPPFPKNNPNPFPNPNPNP